VLFVIKNLDFFNFQKILNSSTIVYKFLKKLYSNLSKNNLKDFDTKVKNL